MSSIPNVPNWVAFFETWRELPELWKVKSDVYKNRYTKKIAWEKLLEIYREIEPDASIDNLKKRLTNIRTCYRRELRKVETSERSGAGTEDEYTPNLWYFSNVDFLRDQEVQIPGLSTMNTVQGEDEDNEVEESGGEAAPVLWSQKKRKSMGQHNMIMAERNSLLRTALEKMTNKDTNKDEASIFAEGWATSYRKLSPNQQIYAKKAIEEILVLGQLDLLSLDTVSNHSYASSYETSAHSPASSMPVPSTYSHQSSRSSRHVFHDNIIEVDGPVVYNNIQQLLSDNNYA